MPTRLPVFILCCVAIACAGISSALARPPGVVATIPPVHSLAALVMEGTGYPGLLMTGTDSPHSFSMRPSQSRMLAAADIVIRVGPGFEVFLNKPLRALSGQAQIVDLSSVRGVRLLQARDEDGHDHHDHGHGHGHGHTHGHDRDGDAAADPHLWLHTENGIAIVMHLAGVLGRKDPENRPVYEGNAARASIRLRALKMEIDRMVDPVRTRPFVTFHDAWRYFTAEYGLKSAGALTLNPERKPGARRLARTRQRIRDDGVRCLFAEPQFPSSLAQVVVRGTPAKIGVLDPLGADLAPGSELYFTLMRRTATEMTNCLGRPAG